MPKIGASPAGWLPMESNGTQCREALAALVYPIAGRVGRDLVPLHLLDLRLPHDLELLLAREGIAVLR